MFKWSKEDAERRAAVEDLTFEEKTGIYCDLCGKFMYEDRGRGRHVVRGDVVSNKHIVPVLELRSLSGTQTLDICDDCSNSIYEKVEEHSIDIITHLITVPRYVIEKRKKEEEDMKEEIRELRRANDTLQQIVNAFSSGRNYTVNYADYNG